MSSLLIEPAVLGSRLGDPGLIVVDLCQKENYLRQHIPGAYHLAYSKLVTGLPPAPGLMPSVKELNKHLGGLGITPQHMVVAYDDVGGSKACRFLWTLALVGHPHFALLNGGLGGWKEAKGGLETGHCLPSPVVSNHSINRDLIADRHWIAAHLDTPGITLLDARTEDEFTGRKVRSLRGGHIPGAKHFNWVASLDRHRNSRLLPKEVLISLLEERGITSDHEIVVYCQTHQRSSQSFIMLRSLGFGRVRGYPGSWSEWGNLPDTPIAVCPDYSHRKST